MNFVIKGISFSKEELTTIPIQQFNVGSINHGHLFVFAGDKPFLMLRAGDYIEGPFLQKYLDRGVNSFWFLNVIDHEVLAKYEGIFNKLKNSNIKALQLEVAEEFYINYVKDFLVDKQVSFLNLIIACYNSFYNLDHGTALKLHHSNTILFNRAIVCSTHAILACLANGFYEFNFIQDLYNLAFVLDIGLTQNNFTYAMERACEAERTKPGSGVGTVSSLAKSPFEIECFTNHPTYSMRYAESMEEKFHYPELLKVLSLHHEKKDGSGFPHGLYYSALSSWECLLGYVDAITDFKTWSFKKGDATDFALGEDDYLKMLKSLEQLPWGQTAINVLSVVQWALKKLSDKDKVEEVA